MQYEFSTTYHESSRFGATNRYDRTTSKLGLLLVYFVRIGNSLGNATNEHNFHECLYDGINNTVRMPHDFKNQSITPDSFEHVQNSRSPIPMTHE